METNGSGGDLSKAGKRHRDSETDSTATDRLSHLPNLIIYHILSFLETKSAVQTSVLSRAWRCAWKHVPVLYLSPSFYYYDLFERFVEKVLSLRYPCSVRKLTYCDSIVTEETEDPLFAKVVEYAARHDVQHLDVDLWNDAEVEQSHSFSNVFRLILNCNNLRTLELERVAIDSGFPSFGFPMLTKLKLRYCPLSFGEDEDLNPFSYFPCLQKLIMEHCLDPLPRHVRARSLKISGLQLLSLKLIHVDFSKIEIVAPKLKYFYILDRLYHSSEFWELNLPSLHHAKLVFGRNYDSNERKKEWVEQHLISLFHGVHNAETLSLLGLIQVLNDSDEFLEKQPSPFTRLKHLNLNLNRHSNKVPYKVVNYFLKGSCVEPVVELGSKTSCRAWL